MSAGDVLSQTQFAHEHWERSSRGVHAHGIQVVANHPKFGNIGRMDLPVHPDEDGNREIYDVNSTLKREGIATGMYNHAVAAGLNPVHSTQRTPEGDAWARKVGGDVPKTNTYKPR
jgi:hypothetical protein